LSQFVGHDAAIIVLILYSTRRAETWARARELKTMVEPVKRAA
jgi:hypothetical protein